MTVVGTALPSASFQTCKPMESVNERGSSE